MHDQGACYAIGERAARHQTVIPPSRSVKLFYPSIGARGRCYVKSGVLAEQEIKRRTRVIRIVPNQESCRRLVTALCAEQRDKWISGMRYLGGGDLRRRHQEQAGEEVTLAAV